MVDFQSVIAVAHLRREAAALDLPVTLLHGTIDASDPLEITASRYAEPIPGAALLIYEGVAMA